MSNRVTSSFQEPCISSASDIATAPPVSCGPGDVRCNDPEFAVNNPDICGINQLSLKIKPEVATLLVGLTLQYATVAVVRGVETAITGGLSYVSSNIGAATINGTSGLATSVAAGTTSITVSWHGLTATAQLTVATACGSSALVVLLDDSKSMQLPFGGGTEPPPTTGNNGLCGISLLTETFEGANSGYDLVTWVETGTVNPDYATSPMQGAQGLRIAVDSARTAHGFTLGLERCVRFRLRADVLPSIDTVFMFFSNGTTGGDIYTVSIDAAGRLRIGGPGGSFIPYTVDGLVAGTNYCVRLHFRGGPTVDDTFMSVEFATTFTFTNAGTKYSEGTSFDVSSDNAINFITCGSGPVSLTQAFNGLVAVYDDITVSDYSTGGVSSSGGGGSGGGSTPYASRLAFAKAGATRLINDADFANSTIGVVRFNTATASIGLTTDKTALLNYVAGTPQTQFNTGIGEALQAAVGILGASSASQKAIVILSDGEQRLPDNVVGLDPTTVASAFKAAGGIIISCGARSSNDGYTLLQTMATGGYFLNALTDTVADVLNLLSGLRGYFCAGTCEDGVGTVGCLSVPPGDQLPDPSPLQDIESSAANSFTFTASCTQPCPSGQIGDSVTRSASYTSNVSMADAELHATALACAAASTALNCCANGPIQIVDHSVNNGKAVPYPACYKVQGVGSTIASLTVRVYGFSHHYPRDVKIMVTGPTGVSVLLMQHCGGWGTTGTPAPCTNVNLVFSDSGSVLLGANSPIGGASSYAIPSGTYKPTKYDADASFDAPANQTLPYSLVLSSFTGTDPNGMWHLYVMDDTNLDVGSIVSWDLVINASEPGCHCTDDAVVRIPSYSTVLSTLTMCGQCAALLAGTQWDGTLSQTGAGICHWAAHGTAFPRLGTTIAFKAAIIEFLVLPNQECTYELRIYCVDATGADNLILIWAGRRADSLSPTGTYTRVNLASDGIVPCSPGPASIDIVT